MDIVTLVTLIANASIAASLIVLIIQIYSQRKENRFSTYEKLMSEFTNASLFLAEHQQIAEFLYGDDPEHTIPQNLFQSTRWASFYYLDALLGLFERVWVARQQGYFQRWSYWRNWISDLSKKAVFLELFENTKQSYDPSFVQEVEEVIRQNKKSKSG
ncbi:MAG: hypothetical protein JRN20_00930 [Nitrososphaerota archaeon]|nr:hypothetical protein [Nitrososphaerota archaeon]MDG6923843.1 hypothetical protein [Nitrososphaerota archaeon]